MIEEVLRKLETITPEDLRTVIEKYNAAQRLEGAVSLDGGHQALVVRSTVLAMTLWWSGYGALKALHDALSASRENQEGS